MPYRNYVHFSSDADDEPDEEDKIEFYQNIRTRELRNTLNSIHEFEQ